MSEIKVNSIKGVGASAAAITVNNSDGTCTLASGSKLNNCTTDGTTNLTIADGNLVVGTAGHGIDFSIDGSSDAGASELLDDYETGTFGPAYFMSNGGQSLSYHDAQGQYVKVGKFVHCSIHLRINTVNANGSGVGGITGLPFTAAANSGQGPGYGTGAVGYIAAMGGSPSWFHGYVEQNSTALYLYTGASSGTSQNVTIANNLYNTSSLRISVTYQTA